MASMETFIDEFIAKYSLAEPAKDDCIEVINNCFKAYIDHMHMDFIKKPTGESSSVTNGKQVTKGTATKTKDTPLENPAEASSTDDLSRCTIQTLSKFCKEHQLKVGGKKEEITARVWRFIQGTNSDEDRPPKARANRTTKATDSPMPQVCQGIKKNGECCNLAGTTESLLQPGKWFCFRHLPEKKPTASPKVSDTEAGDSAGNFESDSAAGSDTTTATTKIKKPKSKSVKVIASTTTPRKGKGKGKVLPIPSPPPPPPLEEESEDSASDSADDSADEH